MELATKPDFERCLDRAEAWWRSELLDRPPVSLFVRSGRAPRKVPAHHADFRQRALDVDYAIDLAAARIEAGVFVAETFPKLLPDLGPEICATAYGAELTFTETTSWSTPCLADIRDATSLTPDLDNPYWNTIRQLTEQSLARGSGQWITAVTDLHTNGDLLAALRDPQSLALDFADDLPAVRRACEHLTPHMKVFFDDLRGRIAAADQPCCTWGPAISRGHMYYVSCDFICMISPKMFAETILPAIAAEARSLERSIFHLDGPGALVHLDALLEIPELDAIQWTYGVGAGKGSDWLDVYRRALAAGKAVEVHAADMHDARAVLDELGPEGVWLSVGGGYSPAEADSFLADLARTNPKR